MTKDCSCTEKNKTGQQCIRRIYLFINIHTFYINYCIICIKLRLLSIEIQIPHNIHCLKTKVSKTEKSNLDAFWFFGVCSLVKRTIKVVAGRVCFQSDLEKADVFRLIFSSKWKNTQLKNMISCFCGCSIWIKLLHFSLAVLLVQN